MTLAVPWRWTVALRAFGGDAEVEVAVELGEDVARGEEAEAVAGQPGAMMHIAVPPTPNCVGRDAELAAVLAAMREPGARVVVSGVPGVGKDVLAVELVRSEWARGLGGVQFWVHGSTEATLRRSLLRLAGPAIRCLYV